MTMDFNTAGPQRSFDLIPADTIATLHLTVRPGAAGDGGWLRRSKDGSSEALDCEFTVVDGEFAKRKIWTMLTVAGTTEGQATAADISRGRLRAMLESARGIKPDDKSEAANAARRIESWSDFDGLRFIGRIGIEPAKGEYKAKNTLLEVIVPTRKEWHHVDQVIKPPGGGNNTPTPGGSAAAPSLPAPVTPATAIARPAWAR
jgi:hypothetical protein